MRKFVLALVVALVGFVGTSTTPTSAVTATTLTVSYNDTRFVSFEVTRQPTVAQYILICAIGATECTPENAADSTKVIRFDCHSDSGTHTTPHACRNYGSTVGNHTYSPASIFSSALRWRPNSPSNYSFLPSGTYTIKVFESANGNAGTYTQISIEQITFPQYSFTYNNAPVLSGDALIGSTLSTASVTWIPEPVTVYYQWLRCSKSTIEYQDFSQYENVPYTIGRRDDLNVDCYVINQDGTIAEHPPELVPLDTQIRAQSDENFYSYTLRDVDENSFIALHVTAESAIGEIRTFATASTSVVERKTAPINQIAPSSSFKKTKKLKKLQVGSRVSVTAGTWRWANTTAIQWFNCTRRQRSTTSINAKQCKSIKRATKANYKVKRADQKRFLVAQVTATNELGSTVVYAKNLGKVR